MQSSLLSSEFCRSTVEMGSTVFSAPGLTRSKARRQPAWTPHLRLWTGMSFQAHSGCEKNPTLCGCRMGVSIFLLSAGSPLLYLRAPAYLTTTSLFPPASSSNQHTTSSQSSNLSPFSFCYILLTLARESSLLLRASVISLGSHR